MNYYHLFLGSQKENILDMHRKGRHSNQSGENNNNAKLKKEDIPVIFRLFSRGWSRARIGRKFKVGYAAISYVVSGKTWIEESRRFL